MIKIALLSPKGPLYRKRGGIFRKSLRYSPLTLPTLAALIPADLPHELTLLDEAIDDIPLDLDADLIGITVITGSSVRAYELAGQFRARGRTVVLGGPHITLVPEDAAPHADALVVGYAEDSWPALLRDFVNGALKPRYDQAPDLSLANRPFARRDLLVEGRYAHTGVFEATRGCIHGCDFCVVPFAWGRKPYQRPVEDVIEEIKSTRARRAIFIDLNIIADRDYAMRLFEALIPLNIQWGGLATTLLARDEELLALCARSGCIAMLIGLESIEKQSLREVHKGFNRPDLYNEIIDAFHAKGISIMGTFAFGADHEGKDIFARTAQWVIDAGVDLPRFAILTPFPGTALYNRLDAEGRILTRNWELYDAQHAVFQPARMTPAELEDGNALAWRLAYTYGAIWRRRRASPAGVLLYAAANLGYRFYARNLKRFYNCDWRLVPEGFAGPAPGVAGEKAA
jgi:radical SAM superfamily enzyme YgiQ (UPF0313 family)